jgi:hypothetical protein
MMTPDEPTCPPAAFVCAATIADEEKMAAATSAASRRRDLMAGSIVDEMKQRTAQPGVPRDATW